MSCIKTGADVYLEQHGALVHGDLFRVGGTFILKCTREWEECAVWKDVIPSERCHLVIYAYEECGVGVIACTEKQASPFSYNGFAAKL